MFVESLGTRLLPTLKEEDITYEAEAVSEDVYEQLGSMPAPADGGELAEIADIAHDAGLNHYLMLSGIRQGLINMFAVGLYHLFEQQLLQFHRRELLEISEEEDEKLWNVPTAITRLESKGFEAERLACWPTIDELRLVANTVKHADGASAKQLRQRQPRYFQSPAAAEFGIEATKSQLFRPLGGEDLFLAVNDIQIYHAAIVEFWTSLARVPSGA